MPENLSKYQSSSSSDQSIESPNLPINKSNSHGTSEETPSQASRLLFNESSTSSSPSIVKEHLLDKYTKGGSKFNIENTKKSHVNMSLRPQHKKASSPLSSPPIVRNSEQDDYFSAQSSSSTVSEVIGGNGSNAFQSSEKLQTANQLQGHDFELPDIKHIHKEHSARESYDSHKSSNSNSNYLSNVRDMMETVDFDDSTVENPRASIYSDTSPSALEEPRRAITHGFGLGNIMDGSLTSGGLAPGAIEPQSEEHHNGNKEHTQNKKRKVVTFGLSNSAPNSTLNTPLLGGAYGDDANEKDIPLVDLSEPKKDHKSKTFYEDLETVARKLVRTHTRHRKNPNDFTIPVDDFDDRHDETQYGEGSGTPPHEGIARKIGDYIAPPTHFRQGVLGSLLKLYSDPSGTANSSGTATPSCRSPSPSATPTPPDETKPKRPLLKSSHSSDSSMKWYTHKHSMSTSSVAGLLMTASSTLSAPGGGVQAMKNIRPNLNHRHSGGILPTKNKNKMKKLAEQIRITVHIADVLQRQRFVLRMCKALMLYGAPTHRLEDYLKMTSRVLELDAQFVYIPGCMIVSFADGTTHTSEVQVLRIVQGLNLYKMHKIHQIYKEVVHDVIGVEEASQRIDDLLAEKNLYPKWLCIIFYGLASAMVTPFAFSGGWLDLPISFVLGSTVGFLQIWVAPRSDLYSNVFEVASSILVSFIGRAFGSIGHNQDVFCFSAIVQGSLALILPGYMILTGALELQSRNIVAGSVRMFYAVIYFLFLIFGITLGAVVYGLIDRNATSSTKCPSELNPLYRILFVPAFAAFIAMVNQAHWKQLPIQVFIAGAGYVVSFFVNTRAGASEVTSSIGAFAIGICGNIYSRVGHGLAFAAMLPGIFVTVPSGVAIEGSLVSGITSADEIIANATHGNETTVTDTNSSSSVLMVGFTVIELSVGITVGLFIAAVVVYPFGKKRSGLFTF